MYYEYIIIGCGPGSLQMGYYLHKNKDNYIILERNDKPGSFFYKYPRHRKMISINKIYNGSNNKDFNLRHDWNSLLCDDDELLMKNYTKEYYPNADIYIKYLFDYSIKNKLSINYNQNVVNIDKINEEFNIITETHVFKCKYLIIATGLHKMNILDIDGSQYLSTYENMSLDKSKYVDQDILIIGNGNSAFETANNLIDVAKTIEIRGKEIKYSYQSHYPGDLRSVNMEYIDTYLLKSLNRITKPRQFQITKENTMCKKLNNGKIHYKFINKSLIKNYLKKYKGDEIKRHLILIDNQIYDKIILCTGFSFDTSIFSDNIKPQLYNNKIPILNSKFESINISNMFFVGTLMQFNDYKISSGAFIHGFRYYIRALFNIIQFEKKNIKWSSYKIVGIDNLTNYIIKRINETSALYQNFGFMADLILIIDNITYYYFIYY